MKKERGPDTPFRTMSRKIKLLKKFFTKEFEKLQKYSLIPM